MPAKKRKVAELSLAEIVPLAKSLAYRIARTPSDVDDLVQVALFAYHRNGLRDRSAVRAPWADARTVLVREMWRYYRKDRGTTVPYMPERDSRAADQSDFFALEDFFRALECEYGRCERLVAENLMVPSPEVAAQLLREARQRQQKGRRRWRDNAHHLTIAKALSISPRRWRRAMQHVRAFARVWFSESAGT